MATADLVVNDEKSSSDEAFSGSGKSKDADEDLGPILTEAQCNRVLRKIDIHILPFVSLLYLLSFLCVVFV